MKTKLITVLLAICFVVTSMGIAFAEGPNGNKRKGKYTYRKVYKACAARGEVSVTKPHISPSDKTMAQWKKIFETKDFSEFKCSEEWNNMSEQDMLDIYSYLYNYAADSPSPATCK